MIKFDLFPTSVFKTTIDPNSYDKKHIVDTCLKNYSIDPNRNFWDKHSDLHHLAGNWENEKFNDIDTSTLFLLYDQVIKELFKNYKFKVNVSYNWLLSNIAVNTKRMEEHDHLYLSGNLNPYSGTNNSGTSMFSCIHYIKFNKLHHSPTTFVNPLPISTYLSILNEFKNLLHNDDILNSPYYNNWHLDNEEDDFVIFPSWLKHKVDPGSSFDQCPRIVSVINIELTQN